MKILPEVDLTRPGPVVGAHSLWCPPEEGSPWGIKLPFQWGGRVQKYKKPREEAFPLDSLREEYAFLSWLATQRMAPPVGGWVYVQTLISEHPGGWWADPCGAYGWEMADARSLPPGAFSVEQLRTSGLVTGSQGAWSDLGKPGNVINGYLVDVRRSWGDRLRYLGPPAPVPRYQEDLPRLWADLVRDGQFPFGERAEPYQEVWWPRRGWKKGERQVVGRAMALKLFVAPGESVLDIGCHTGGFLQFVALQQQGGPLVGVDVREEYIQLARRIARATGMNLCYRQMDVEVDLEGIMTWLATLLPEGRPDHLLLLSMAKHFTGTEPFLWALVDRVRATRTYLESNATTAEQWPLREEVEVRGGQWIGDSTDRNLRRLYVL